MTSAKQRFFIEMKNKTVCTNRESYWQVKPQITCRDMQNILSLSLSHSLTHSHTRRNDIKCQVREKWKISVVVIVTARRSVRKGGLVCLLLMVTWPAAATPAPSFLPRPVTTKWLQRHKRRQEPSEHFMVGNTNGHPIHPDDLALTCFTRPRV